MVIEGDWTLSCEHIMEYTVMYCRIVYLNLYNVIKQCHHNDFKFFKKR